MLNKVRGIERNTDDLSYLWDIGNIMVEILKDDRNKEHENKVATWGGKGKGQRRLPCMVGGSVQRGKEIVLKNDKLLCMKEAQ